MANELPVAAHLAACVLARLDGKSPVEYRHELDQDAARRFSRLVFLAVDEVSLTTLIEDPGIWLGE